jgi:hypothetical protein
MYIVKVKECISDLALRRECNKLFSYIESLSDEYIIVDFEGFELCSRAFIHQYLMNKRKSNKKIEEINVSKFITDMMNVVKNNLP